jgi:hypothetical protein
MTPSVVTFDMVVTAARTRAGLTAAEFDYDLTHNNPNTAAPMALDAVMYELANQHLPTIQTDDAPSALWERANNAARMHEKFRADVKSMIEAAQRKQYIGWSNASGGPIRYANPAR